MESSTAEQRNREETNWLYSPCYFFEKVSKAVLKCLGLDSTTEQAQHPPPPPRSEREEAFAANTTRSSTVARRPPRPPLSSGRGGQIN